MKYYDCRNCKKNKCKRQFSKAKIYSRGFDIYCKTCRNKWKREKYSYKDNRGVQLKCLYGITENDYQKMYIQQNGVCAVCGKINLDGKRLFVDHNHITKEIRGLLCRSCNMAIGVFEKDISLFYLAADYVEGFPRRLGVSSTMKSTINRPKHDGEIR